MSNHLKAADYHRAAVRAEVAIQGSGRYASGDGWESSRGRQLEHQHAAGRAESAHAAVTGQQVVYTPCGEPVFSKGR